MSSIQITEADTKIRVFAPYDDACPPQAKDLGGKWSPATKTWDFSIKDRARVEALLTTIYGWTQDPKKPSPSKQLFPPECTPRRKSLSLGNSDIMFEVQDLPVGALPLVPFEYTIVDETTRLLSPLRTERESLIERLQQIEAQIASMVESA